MIRASSFDMPGGNQIQRRRDIDQNYGANVGEEFADVVVLTRPDGTRLLLDEIAEIKDTFEEFSDG